MNNNIKIWKVNSDMEQADGLMLLKLLHEEKMLQFIPSLKNDKENMLMYIFRRLNNIYNTHCNCEKCKLICNEFVKKYTMQFLKHNPFNNSKDFYTFINFINIEKIIPNNNIQYLDLKNSDELIRLGYEIKNVRDDYSFLINNFIKINNFLYNNNNNNKKCIIVLGFNNKNYFYIC